MAFDVYTTHMIPILTCRLAVLNITVTFFSSVLDGFVLQEMKLSEQTSGTKRIIRKLGRELLLILRLLLPKKLSINCKHPKN